MTGMNPTYNILLLEDAPEETLMLEQIIQAFPRLPDYRFISHFDKLPYAMEVQEPSVIICSLNLNGFEPEELLDEMTFLFSDYPVIILAEHIQQEFSRTAIKAGAQDFLIRSEMNDYVLLRAIEFAVERFRNRIKLQAYANALEDSEAKLKLAQKIGHIGYWEVADESEEMIWSDSVYQLFERSKDTFTPTLENFVAITHPDEKELVSKAFKYALESNEHFNFDQRVMIGEGKIKYINTQIQPVESENKFGQKLIGTFQDISSRKEIEKLLLESEDKYRTLFHVSRDGIYMTTVDGQFEEFNKSAEEMMGYSRAELMKINVSDLYANRSERQNFKRTISEQGYVEDYEIRIRRKDGSLKDVIVTSNLRKDAAGNIVGFQGIIRDITEQKRTQQLIKEKELAEKTAQLKEEFLANMSHEIRTPLNAVYGLINLMLDTPLDKQQRGYINTMKSSSKHLMEIINDILDFSKLEAGKMKAYIEEFSLRQLVEEQVIAQSIKADEKKLQLLSEIKGDVPDLLIGDRIKLNQILFNLIGNAIKFTDKGFVKLQVELLEQSEGEAKLRFLVVDSGIGIPADKLKDIFESFTQVDAVNIKKHQGTGLGLAITKRLVDLMGGTIEVSSEEGRGSTFEFVLSYELNEVQHGHHSQKPISHKSQLPDLHYNRILLVEDNAVNQVVVKGILDNWLQGVTIDVANNGFEALKRFDEHPYDIILMDVQMPELDGIQTTQRIRSSDHERNNIPIIALTAYSSPRDAEKCLEGGMNEFVSKPFEPEELQAKIVALMGGKTAELANVPTAPEKTESGSGPVFVPTYFEYITKHDDKLRKQMIDIVQEEVPAELTRLKNALEAKDWRRAYLIAHKQKSSIAFLGNEKINNLAKQITESLKHEQELESVSQRFTEMQDLAHRALEEMKARYRSE